jgi:hypothetical protein
MDWLLWLVPILLLVLIYPFVTVGCGLDTQGQATSTPDSSRSLLLHFENIPKLGSIPITAITVQYELSSGGTTIPVPTTGAVSLQYDPATNAAQGDVPTTVTQVPFAAGTSMQCVCRVMLQRQEWNNSLPAIGPLIASVTTANDVMAWRLTYIGWPDTPDYDPASFQLSLD